MAYRLVIGNKTTSSWSLRPWLAMANAGIPFEEVRIDLRDKDAKAQILAHSPAGKVPALITDDGLVWDSLAILEFLAEALPRAGLWPEDRAARAQARSVCAEMHAGFQALRDECPMNLFARTPKADVSSAVAADVARIVAIWRTCRGRVANEGPFLFGRFTAADAMYAPVATRFRTYLPDLGPYGDDGTAQAYADALFALPAMAAWEEGARAEAA